jgi:hypothetical protein
MLPGDNGLVMRVYYSTSGVPTRIGMIETMIMYGLDGTRYVSQASETMLATTNGN